MKKFFKVFLPILVAVPLLYVGAFYFLQEKLIFKAVPLPDNYTYTFEVPFQEVFLSPKDGVSINALHFTTKNPKGIVVYYHGQGGNLAKRWDSVSRKFIDAGYDFFIMDYRTFGKSRGELTQETLLSDACFVYDHCKELFDEKNIIVYGCSLGTGVASYVSSKNSPKQVVLESPYRSMVELATYTASYLPKIAIPHILKYPMRTDQWIHDITSPLLILHGTHDTTIPYYMGKALYDMTHKLLSVEMLTVEAIGHNDIAAHPETLESLQSYL